MADRVYGVSSRGRSPRTRKFSPPRHRSREEYSRRIEKRDNPDRYFSSRAVGVSDFSPSRKRKCYPGGREEYSQRIEKRDSPYRNFSPRAVRVSDFSHSRDLKHSPGDRGEYYPRIEKRDGLYRNFSPRALRVSDSSPSRGRKCSPGSREEYSWRIEKRDNPYRNFSPRALGVSEFSPSRHRTCSPRGREEYSQRIEKRDIPRAVGLSEYDHRDRERNAAGDNRRYRSPSSSPLRIDSSQYTRFPDYEDSGKVKNKDVVNAGHPMRPHDEGSYREDSSLNRFKWDRHLLDGPRKPDYNGVGERDYYYPLGRNLDSVSQYPDSTKESVSIKYEREERMHLHSYNSPVSNLKRDDSSSYQFPSVVSRYLNADANKHHLEKRDGSLHDDQDGHFLEKKKGVVGYLDGSLGIGEERVGEEKYSFKNEYSFPSSQGYLKEDSNYMAPSYQPRNYVSGFWDYSTTSRDHNVMSHMGQGGSELTAQPVGFNGYKQNMENMQPRVTGGQLNDKRSASRVYIEENQFGSSGIGSMSTRLNDVEEDYRGLHVSRNDAFKHAVDECFHKKPMKDDMQLDPYSFSRVRSTPDELDANKLLHAQNQDLGSSQLNFGYGPESRVDSGQWSRVERSDILQPRGYDPDPVFGRYSESLRNRSGLVDLSLDEHFESRLRKKHDKMVSDQDVEIRVSADGNGAQKIYKEREFLDLSKKPKSSKADYEETRRWSAHLENDRPTTSIFHPSRFYSGDVKKRLGPVPRKLHVSQRLMRKYKPSVKRQFTLAPRQKKSANFPRIKNLSSNVTSNVQDPDGSPLDHEGVDYPPHAKPEPPEKSKEFKLLVHNTFFKFLKQINETPMKRKMYMEQGKAGTLKCVVCGSNSDEFSETESLARHAFSSKKAGLRSQHLGLHKALCGMMGWKTEEDLRSEWVCEVMSNAAASDLKEDLIIWPPVVIVHNSTISTKSPDERVIVSTDELDKKLRDMGFGSIVKVCKGKPANQSVMLVKFNATLSGLQEAERCHQRYLESNHGRSELEQLKPTQVIASPDRGEDYFLYGHLGIFEDMDKLDFDTKRRCVIKSKKEILNIVNAPLGENTCS